MKAVKFAVLFFVFVLTMTTGNTLAAQQPTDPPSAPVPAAIFSAKKVFISNATGEIALPPGNPDLTYNEFYAAMKSGGRYELVTSPADADLVLEIRFTFAIGPTGVSQGSGGSTQDFQFRLVILDPKSRILLWAFSESIPQSGNKVKSRQFFDQTMAAIVDDLKKLASRAGSGG